MQIKANFHFHTCEDPFDIVDYSLEEGIDYAHEHGFRALAITAHRAVLWTPERAEYAAKRGMLLISGIELNVGDAENIYGRHVVVLNVDKRAEDIITFDDLRAYKREKKDIFILAAHPYFYGTSCLKEYLERHIDLFDAIEISWFYSRLFNRNKRAFRIAQIHQKPLMATSDTHFFNNNHMERNYVIIEAETNTPEDIFSALRRGSYTNFTKPSNFLRDMVWVEGQFYLRDYFRKRALRTVWRSERRKAFYERNHT